METRTERTKTIEVLEKEFKDAKGIYLTDINRIDVARITKLRNEIRKKGMKYIVVKNTLARIAFERCGKKDLTPFLKGQIGVVVAHQEGMAPAKIIRDFQKECAKDIKNIELLPVKVAYVDGTTFSGKDTARLADIPSRDVLLSQLLGVLQAPMAKFAGTLNSVLTTFAGTLDAVRRKKESEPPTS
ncbi:MAG TPA: 50S ribosomal protein L10 [Chitinivibrionales bacterium]|jgi:large subunit ribosomal protein L10|nr:50S ribosomal protein L10 [Chitinivibrionales bacterium]